VRLVCEWVFSGGGGWFCGLGGGGKVEGFLGSWGGGANKGRFLILGWTISTRTASRSSGSIGSAWTRITSSCGSVGGAR